MKNLRLVCVCLLISALSLSSVRAQTASPSPASSQEAPSQSTQGVEVVVPDGTEFSVVTTEEISSRTATEGDPVTLRVADDVIINGRVVITKDTIVRGVISNVESRGRMGRGGRVGMRIDSTTTVDNQGLRLRASRNNSGNDTTGSTIALSVLISPLFLLRRGRHARIPANTRIRVFTDEEKRVLVTTPPVNTTGN